MVNLLRSSENRKCFAGGDVNVFTYMCAQAA